MGERFDGSSRGPSVQTADHWARRRSDQNFAVLSGREISTASWPNEMAMLTWTDVVRLHQTNEGIAVVGGRAVSLICNIGKRSKYPNRIDGEHIEYVVGPKTKRGGVDALIRAASESGIVRVFTKRATDDWVDLGWFVVERVDSPDEMGFRRFHLVKSRAA